MFYSPYSCNYDSLNIRAFTSHVLLQALELGAVQVLPAVPRDDPGSWAWIRDVLLGA